MPKIKLFITFKRYFAFLFSRWAAHQLVLEDEEGEPIAVDTYVVFIVLEQLTNINYDKRGNKGCYLWEGVAVSERRSSAYLVVSGPWVSNYLYFLF